MDTWLGVEGTSSDPTSTGCSDGDKTPPKRIKETNV